jgi:ABC-type enterobactin transport system permease subunit
MKLFSPVFVGLIASLCSSKRVGVQTRAQLNRNDCESSIEKPTGLAERECMKHLIQKGLPFILVFVLSLTSAIAFAAQDVTTGEGEANDVFVNVQNSVCTIAAALRGPAGVAVGFLVLVAGLVAMQVANRDAIPMISRALVGTALLLGAGAAFAAIITGTECN